ncbi:hypothetical protein [Bacillus atrophaeus]|uniref:hypothetical protein n=1 Tax=Bacillus atrophaeus TaxID=1452 RepID=UPI002E220551|nr:hypothetical protein [Bacillus atrophaeus]MED1029760.1 hypothetical protein [Bacillus atrophaeus]MED1117525.1 hypothetical protein [Bacillus atrophaeus]MED1131297.1 hypothetical protein [Bacillus atrophaeus]
MNSRENCKLPGDEQTLKTQRLTIPIENFKLTIITGTLTFVHSEDTHDKVKFCFKEPRVKKLIKDPIISANISSGDAFCHNNWAVLDSSVNWDSKSKGMNCEVEIVGNTQGLFFC